MDFWFSIGINVTFITGLSFSLGLYVDDNGNLDTQITYSAPWIDETKHFGAFDAAAGLTFQFTDRDTVYDLYGSSTIIGASGGPGWYIGGDIITFDEIYDDPEINGFQFNLGVGVGFDSHIVKTKTEQVTFKYIAGQMQNKPYLYIGH